MFKKKEKIVCPMYGAGVLEDIVKEKIDGKNVELYKLKLAHSQMELYIPTNMSEKNGLRKISSKSVFTRAIKVLKEELVKPSDEDMRRIATELSEVIKKSTVKECALWLSKLLYRRRNSGQLNTNEKKLFLSFKLLLCGELSLIKDIDYKESEKQFDKIIKKNNKLTEEDISFFGFDEFEDE